MLTGEQAAKIPFMTLYNKHGLTISELGMYSGLEPIVFAALFAGISIPRTIAERVLQAINDLKGTRYTLDLVDIAINEYASSLTEGLEGNVDGKDTTRQDS